MTPEQKATYWEVRAKQQFRGHQAYRVRTDREIDLLRKAGVKDPDPTVPVNPTDDDLAKALGIKADDPSLPVLGRIVEIAENRALSKIARDPAFGSAVTGANMARLHEAFNTLAKEEGYEAVLTYKQEIIDRYFQDPLNIPQDVMSVLKPIAGGVLYEHRDEIDTGRKPKHDRVEMLGGQGGDKKPAPARSLEYWERFAQENPAEFAKPEIQKMFNEDMAKL